MKQRSVAIFSYAKIKIHSTPSLNGLSVAVIVVAVVV